MQKNLVSLAIIFAVMATVYRESPGTLPAPSPAPAISVPAPVEGSEQLQPGPPLSYGDLLVSFAKPSDLGQLSQAQVLSKDRATRGPGPLLSLKVRSVSDHRWIHYGEPQVQIENRSLRLVVPTYHDTMPHIENYVESVYESRAVSVELEPGRYQVYLGEHAVGVLEVERS
jgi:hypothetical protein